MGDCDFLCVGVAMTGDSKFGVIWNGTSSWYADGDGSLTYSFWQ